MGFLSGEHTRISVISVLTDLLPRSVIHFVHRYTILIFLLFISRHPEGVVEIWLTSEDTGAYGKDIGVTLPELLWQLVDVIPEGARLRLGMTNPPYIYEHLEVFVCM